MCDPDQERGSLSRSFSCSPSFRSGTKDERPEMLLSTTDQAVFGPDVLSPDWSNVAEVYSNIRRIAMDRILPHFCSSLCLNIHCPVLISPIVFCHVFLSPLCPAMSFTIRSSLLYASLRCSSTCIFSPLDLSYHFLLFYSITSTLLSPLLLFSFSRLTFVSFFLLSSLL